MQSLEIYQIDAFAKNAYEGNPCAVVFVADDLTESSMQLITQEMNLSETAFVMVSEKGDFRARYLYSVIWNSSCGSSYDCDNSCINNKWTNTNNK